MSSSFLNPSVTPETAFATRLRARPWNLRSSSSSRESLATSAPASCENRMPGGSGWRSLPFGPWTSTASGAIFTVTPFGIGIGFLPIRDIADPSRWSPAPDPSSAAASSGETRRRPVTGDCSPYVAEHFAADAGLPRRAAGHHSARGREDARPQSAEDTGNILHTQVDAAPWTADPLQPGDDLLTPRSVLQEHAYELARLLALPHRGLLDDAKALDV